MGKYLYKGSTKTMCETGSKLTTKTPERRHCRHLGVFIVNVEQISHILLVILLMTLNN